MTAAVVGGEVKFQREEFCDELMCEIAGMGGGHYAEIGEYADMVPEVDREQYRRVSGSGQLRVFTVRCGGLVGYAAFVLGYHRHFKGSFQAVQDLIYLAPGYRKGMLGLDFIKWCDGELGREGVAMVYHYSSARRDIGVVLSRAGYMKTQELWVRRLV